MGHHLLQSWLHFAAVHQIPVGIVFLDLHSAFYHVLREGLFGVHLTDDALCIVLLQHGFSEDDLREFGEQAVKRMMSQEIVAAISGIESAMP